MSFRQRYNTNPCVPVQLVARRALRAFTIVFTNPRDPTLALVKLHPGLVLGQEGWVGSHRGSRDHVLEKTHLEQNLKNVVQFCIFQRLFALILDGSQSLPGLSSMFNDEYSFLKRLRERVPGSSKNVDFGFGSKSCMSLQVSSCAHGKQESTDPMLKKIVYPLPIYYVSIR